MNKILIHNLDQFIKETKRLNLQADSPTNYPCILLSYWAENTRRGGYLDYDFIYLEDFELRPCSDCERIEEIIKLDWNDRCIYCPENKN